MRAFQNSPALKAEAMAQLEGDAQPPILKWAGEWDDLPAWSERYGLPQVLTMLTSTLGSDWVGEDAGRGYVRDLLASIPVGADLSPAAHHWVLWAWAEAPQPIGDLTRASALRDAAGAVVKLHGDVLDGLRPDRAQWRQARSTVNAAAALASPIEAAAARVMAAGAWDFDATPGAGADMASAWADVAQAQVWQARGWSQEKADAGSQLGQEAAARVQEKVGASPDKTDPGLEAWRERRGAVWQAEFAAITDPLYWENKAVFNEVSEACKVIRDQSRVALLRLVGAPLPAGA